MKAYGEVDVCIYVFSTSALVGGEWLNLSPGRFTPSEIVRDTHCIGGWVDPRAGLDDMENIKFLALTVLELRPLGCPARSQSLYRLRYLGSKKETNIKSNWRGGNSLHSYPGDVRLEISAETLAARWGICVVSSVFSDKFRCSIPVRPRPLPFSFF
jgi:hypothetical protein